MTESVILMAYIVNKTENQTLFINTNVNYFNELIFGIMFAQ